MTEGDGVVVDTVAAVTVNRVKTDGTVAGSTVTDGALNDVTTSSNGSVVFGFDVWVTLC